MFPLCLPDTKEWGGVARERGRTDLWIILRLSSNNRESEIFHSLHLDNVITVLRCIILKAQGRSDSFPKLWPYQKAWFCFLHHRIQILIAWIAFIIWNLVEFVIGFCLFMDLVEWCPAMTYFRSGSSTSSHQTASTERQFHWIIVEFSLILFFLSFCYPYCFSIWM